MKVQKVKDTAMTYQATYKNMSEYGTSYIEAITKLINKIK